MNNLVFSVQLKQNYSKLNLNSQAYAERAVAFNTGCSEQLTLLNSIRVQLTGQPFFKKEMALFEWYETSINTFV